MRITPDFIPHNKFHLGSWLIEKDNPSWYYFLPKRDLKNIFYGKNFYDTLDKPLKTVVKFLHKNNINTTPSCTGHFYPKKVFEKTFDSLNQASNTIKNKGLILQNPETGEFYKYRDSDYVLPWNKNDFVGEALSHQTKGCLGIKPNNSEISNLFIKRPIKGFKTFHDPNHKIIIFVTKSNSPEEKNDKWEYFTEKIINSIS